MSRERDDAAFDKWLESIGKPLANYYERRQLALSYALAGHKCPASVKGAAASLLFELVISDGTLRDAALFELSERERLRDTWEWNTASDLRKHKNLAGFKCQNFDRWHTAAWLNSRRYYR
jgi:hypothetical protein